jgi:purine-binding chemotaxis protein CheW
MHTGEARIVGLLIFELDGQRCAVMASEVLEVQRAVAIARLPRCPKIVEGVIDLRGKLVPVLDVRARLGLPPRPLALSDHLVVARVPRTRSGAAAQPSDPRVVAIRVDRALDLLTVPPEKIEDPRLVAGAVQAVGVAKLADGLVLIHDLRSFLSLDEELQLDQAFAERSPQ